MAQVDGGVLAARQLKHCGIDTLFGVVAGPMIQLFSGGQREGLQVVGCRHEVNGGFMASAWGWQKRLPGIMIAGSGPAVTNCVTPLYVATESAMPLVVLGGSAFSSTTGLGGFQELDQIAVTRPVCKWTGRVDSTERIPEWIHLAVGKALEGKPGGVYLDFPGDLVGKTVDDESVRFRTAPEISRPHPDPDVVVRVADLLANAERPLILIGKGAAWSDAGPSIAKLVDLGIPYVCAPMARGTLPDDHPNFANAARSQALAGADVIVMFGGRFNWIFSIGQRSLASSPFVLCGELARGSASDGETERTTPARSQGRRLGADQPLPRRRGDRAGTATRCHRDRRGRDHDGDLTGDPSLVPESQPIECGDDRIHGRRRSLRRRSESRLPRPSVDRCTG